MKHRAFTWIEVIVIIAIIIILAALLFPAFNRQPHSSRKWSCQSNLKQIGLGMAQYTQDYDEKWPNISFGGATYGWVNALQPYVKSTQIFQCPTEGNNSSKDPMQNFYTDYWYNARIAGITQEKIKFPFNTIILGDGNDGQDRTDARYSQSTLPPAWIADNNSPAFRHFDGANYGFADGHVKFLKPEIISDSASNKAAPTFRVR